MILIQPKKPHDSHQMAAVSNQRPSEPLARSRPWTYWAGAALLAAGFVLLPGCRNQQGDGSRDSWKSQPEKPSGNNASLTKPGQPATIADVLEASTLETASRVAAHAAALVHEMTGKAMEAASQAAGTAPLSQGRVPRSNQGDWQQGNTTQAAVIQAPVAQAAVSEPASTQAEQRQERRSQVRQERQERRSQVQQERQAELLPAEDSSEGMDDGWATANARRWDSSTDPWWCCTGNEPNMSVYVGHLEAQGVGFDDGYSTFGLFFTPTLSGSPCLFPLIDGRLHAFNEGKLAANAGAGLRWIGGDSVWGVNVFYDWRNEHRDFNRGGVGAEWLSCGMDLRVNGYFPLNRSVWHGHKQDYRYPGGWEASCRPRQKCCSGADAELGVPLKCWDDCSTSIVYAAAGPYYYRNGGCVNDNIYGGRVRLQIDYLNYISFETRVLYDNVFHTNVQGLLTFRIPFGNQKDPAHRRSDTSDCCYDSLRAIAAQPIQRNEIPVFNDRDYRWEHNWCGCHACDSENGGNSGNGCSSGNCESKD